MGMAPTHQEVQKAAERASLKALRNQAEALLPGRLKQLADTMGFEYNSVRVKRLTGRWGSCDRNKDIVLNLFLMQLPWQLIDYVLIHELTHTKHLNHSAEFWAEMTRHEPRAKYLRRVIRRYKPVLTPLADLTA
jgi:predicted metal-dependent hydrolase